MEIKKQEPSKMLSPYRIRMVGDSHTKNKERKVEQKEKKNPEGQTVCLPAIENKTPQKNTLNIGYLQKQYQVKELVTRKFYVPSKEQIKKRQEEARKAQQIFWQKQRQLLRKAEAELNFLDPIFQDLESRKTNLLNKQLEVGSVYPNYRTVQIQQLEPKGMVSDNFHKDGKEIWKTKKNNVLFYKENGLPRDTNSNGFFYAIYAAYMLHGDLKLTPDDVWLTIMLYFSKYVNDNAKQLRRAFVSHQGKKKLTVRVAGTDLTHQKIWDEFFKKMIEQIKKNTIQKVTSNLECDFSSTDKFAKIFSTATIMNSFKKFFQYEMEGGGCGIVRIHMGGSLEDWERLQKKLQYLRQFDVDGQMKKYVDRLMPVLGQFTETYKGNAHLEFWNNLYHERKNPKRQFYEPYDIINGWLMRFFTIKPKFFFGENLQIEQLSVPIHFINLYTGQQKDLTLVGGSRGHIVEDGKVFRPHFSFAVTQPNSDDAARDKKQKK